MLQEIKRDYSFELKKVIKFKLIRKCTQGGKVSNPKKLFFCVAFQGKLKDKNVDR